MGEQFERDYLRQYLVHAPAALALLRAVECRELSKLHFERPILDVGCGDGLFGRVFFQDRGQVEVGFDRSQSELDTAARHGAYQKLVQGDVAQLPFPDQSFATVFSNGVLEHVDDLAGGLREIARTLRLGGRLIMTVPTMRDELELSGAALLKRCGLEKQAVRYADAYNRFFHHVNVHEVAEWKAILAQAGLQLVEHRHYAVPMVFRLHDLMLPASLPNFVCKRITGLWSAAPALRNLTLAPFWSRVLRSIYEDSSDGCSLLLVAERTPS